MLSIESRLASELAVKPQQVAAPLPCSMPAPPFPSSPATARRRPKVSTMPSSAPRGASGLFARARRAPRRHSQEHRGAGKLTVELKAAVAGADTKQRLEDLYLPYKPKRRTKAMIAREAGLDGLAAALLANPGLDPETEAAKYLKAAFTTENGENPGAPDAKVALDGARQILMEQFAEDAQLLGELR